MLGEVNSVITHTVCNNYIELGMNAYKQGRPDVGSTMLTAALEEAERLSGIGDPPGAVFNKLAYWYYSRNEVERAEAVYEQALAQYDRLLQCDPSEHSNILFNLAELYFSQQKYHQAAPLYDRVIGLNRTSQRLTTLLERALLKRAWIHCGENEFNSADKLYGIVRRFREAELQERQALLSHDAAA